MLFRSTDWIEGQLLFDDREGEEVDYGVDGVTSLQFIKVIHPRTKKEVPPTFIDGRVLPDSASQLPRVALAKWMTSHPWFAEAAVNRMWAYFFGRGFVNPVDDFSVTNPPTHPQLLTALAEDFRSHGYDLKHLFRLITQSQTYQLSSTSNESNRDEEINYSHALARPLEAEVLLDAISSATGVPETWSEK